MLEERHITELIGIYADVLGMDISREYAVEQGIRLLSFMKAILDGDPSISVSSASCEEEGGVGSC